MAGCRLGRLRLCAPDDLADGGTDIVRADQADRDMINALDTNLKPFFDRGGKLLPYHGWSDPQISPGNGVEYAHPY